MENLFRSLFLSGERVWSEASNQPAAGDAAQRKQNEVVSAVHGSPGQRKRKRTLYSKWQQVELESVFEVIPYPDISTREQLAKIIRLPESKVQVWFQNRRARKNKSSKLDKTLYRRDLSLPSPHLHLSIASPFHYYSPINAKPFSPHQPGPYGRDGVQHAGYPLQTYFPVSQQHSEEKSYHGAYRQELPWQDISSNAISPGYSYETTLYDTQTVETEQCTASSYGAPYWELFPHTVHDNASQTSLGNLSDVIYSAALVTNIGAL